MLMVAFSWHQNNERYIGVLGLRTESVRAGVLRGLLRRSIAFELWASTL
jgi:hypothetical protein